MAARSRGNRSNSDWLRWSCDISTCDLSTDGNPEKYGRPTNQGANRARTNHSLTPDVQKRLGCDL